jgi:hypothetical protein
MKQVDKALLKKIGSITVKSQNQILNRLRLFDFAQSAIIDFCNHKYNTVQGYDYPSFKSKFQLIKFNPEKPIKSISYKEIIDTGKSFIGDELSDSIFVLNVATFENWILSALNLKMRSNTNDLFKDNDKKDSDKVVDISVIQDSVDMDDLWDKLIGKYLQKLPYGGMKNMILKLLKEFSIKQSDISTNLIDKINENSLCRNIIVHNQKIINDEYIIKCGKFAVFNKGDTIHITEKLLFEQGDNLLGFMQEFKKIGQIHN